eukprot:15343721-Ditylum_brightwellii.AAC.1
MGPNEMRSTRSATSLCGTSHHTYYLNQICIVLDTHHRLSTPIYLIRPGIEVPTLAMILRVMERQRTDRQTKDPTR